MLAMLSAAGRVLTRSGRQVVAAAEPKHASAAGGGERGKKRSEAIVGETAQPNGILRGHI